MATIVKAKLIGGSAYTFDKSGGHKTEIYLITGLDPAAGDVQFQASQAAGVPRYFQSHASIGGIVATSLRFEPFKDSKTKVKGYIEYTTPEFTGTGDTFSLAIRVDSTAQRITTNLDEDGKLIQVDYTSPDGTDQPSQYADFPTLEHGTVIEFSQDMPLTKFQEWSTYRRRLNSDDWQGGEPRTWACIAICGTTIDTSHRMRATARFEWRESGWDEIGFWKDSTTGTAPNDIADDFNANKDTDDSGNGWTRGIILKEKDFRDLGFPEILKAP